MLLKTCFIFGIALTLFLATRLGVSTAFASDVKSVWTENLPHESWMNVMLMGVKVGRFHVHADRAEYKGQSVIRVSSSLFAEIKRFGLSMKTSKTKLCYLRNDLSPCYFYSKSDETGQEKIVEGTIENGVVTIKTTLEGRTTEKQQKLPKGIIFAETLEEMALRKGLKVGEKYSLEAFSLDFFDIIKVNIHIKGKDKIQYKGATKDVFIVDFIIDVMGGITTTEWITADGEVYKMEMPNMAMSFVKVEKDEAMGDVEQIDLLIKTKVDLSGEKPKPGIDKFKVKAILSDGSINDAFVTNYRQKVTVGSDPKEGIIEINVNNMTKSGTLNRPIKRSEMLPYLAPSIYIQSDDPEIIQKANEIAGDEKNSWETAKKICQWVNKSIKDKNYKVGFGTAKQTLKDLQGDCSEHTVLFIGLARALGIPARISTGLVYHKDAFYYHFWPEVFVGEWVAMEPTLGQLQADATHIQFSSNPVETESALELGEGVLRTMNRIQIQRVD